MLAYFLFEIFGCHGTLQEMLSNQGTNFISELMKCLFNKLRIYGIKTTPYHPHCNGLVVRKPCYVIVARQSRTDGMSRCRQCCLHTGKCNISRLAIPHSKYFILTKFVVLWASLAKHRGNRSGNQVEESIIEFETRVCERTVEVTEVVQENLSQVHEQVMV